MRLLLLDNYDSFTWNLYQYLEGLGATVRVELNDRVNVDRIRADRYDAIVISPGPGRPEAAGACLEVVRALSDEVPMLGVCLGHQAVAQAFGATIVRARTLMHGKTSTIVHDGTGVFRGVPQGFSATRYHSLVVDPSTLGPDFVVNAQTPDGEVMGLRHRTLPVHGVQFHPESVLTLEGKRILANFLELAA